MKQQQKIRVCSSTSNSIDVDIKKRNTNALDLRIRLEKSGIGKFFERVQGNEEAGEQYNYNSPPTPQIKQFLKLSYIIDTVMPLYDKMLIETSKPELLSREEESEIKDFISNPPKLLTISLSDLKIDEK